MPRYFFDIHDGRKFFRDEEGSECADFDKARLEAMTTLPQIALHEIPQDGDRQAFTILVHDESGAVIYTATLSYAGLKLDGETQRGLATALE